MTSDETTHVDILIRFQKGPQDNQYLAGYPHGAGRDEILSRKEEGQSSKGILARDWKTVEKRGAGKGLGLMVPQNLGKEVLT